MNNKPSYNVTLQTCQEGIKGFDGFIEAFIRRYLARSYLRIRLYEFRKVVAWSSFIGLSETSDRVSRG